MKKQLFLAGIILITLSGCAKYDKSNRGPYHPNGYYCQQITRQLHADVHRHNAGQKLTSIGEARLMKEYKRYDCDRYKG